MYILIAKFNIIVYNINIGDGENVIKEKRI